MHKAKDDLTFEYVSSRLSYDKDSGLLIWMTSKFKPFIGAIAGYMLKDGGIAVKIESKLYKAHRLGWLLNYGSWPNGDLDHINGNRADNRICNLRIATIRQNGQNRKDNKTKLCGAWKHGNKWYSAIVINGKKIFLGSFNKEIEAHIAYINAIQEYDLEPFIDNIKEKVSIE